MSKHKLFELITKEGYPVVAFYHTRSEHVSLQLGDVSVQGSDIETQHLDDYSTLYLWTEQGDMSACLDYYPREVLWQNDKVFSQT